MKKDSDLAFHLLMHGADKDIQNNENLSPKELSRNLALQMQDENVNKLFEQKNYFLTLMNYSMSVK